jgi:hypothetical protein
VANLIKQYGTRFAKFVAERVKVYQTPLISAPLALYYPFDYDNRDYSMNGRDLTNNAPNVFGKSPSKFNGSALTANSLLIRDAEVDFRTTTLTTCAVSFWIYFDALNNCRICRFRGYDDTPFGFQSDIQLTFVNTSSPPQWQLGNFRGGFTPVSTSYAMTPNLSQWYHIVINFDGPASGGALATLYIDGVSVLTNQVASYDFFPQYNYFGIGSDAGLPQLNGYADEAAVFNRLLTLSEISDLYNATRPIRILP